MNVTYKTKAELPLNVRVSAVDLRLNYLGFRKRIVKSVSFAGMTRQEAIEESREYLRSNKGRFVENPNSVVPCGVWTNCELERDDCAGHAFIWKTAPIFRDGRELSKEDLDACNDA